MTAARIATALAELADLHEQLGLLVWATRPAGHAPPGPRTPDLAMIAERDKVVNTLTTWVRVVEDHGATAAPGDCDVPTLVTWLGRRTTWICDQGWADEFVLDLQAGIDAIRAYLERSETYVVPVCGCPMTGCGGTVRAKVHRHDHLLPAVLTCDVYQRRIREGYQFGPDDKPHRWQAGEWRGLVKDMHARWMTADEVAVLYGTSVEAVWQMAHRRGWTRTRTRPVGYLASDVAGLTSGMREDVPA